MKEEQLAKFVQAHLGDGLAVIVGSGLSAAEGIPGMPELAIHLTNASTALGASDASRWATIQGELDAGVGLEAALLKHMPSVTLEAWIIGETCAFLIPSERRVASAVINGDSELRLTKFLSRCLRSPNGLPIVTPNYDRLTEIACEMAGYHVDTGTIGTYAGTFDMERSFMAACKSVTSRGKVASLDFHPRAIVLKPHGSFDWYRHSTTARRSCMDIDGAERMIITPGINKYKAGYAAPFDVHRALANEHIDRASRLLVVGYGFNDDHLQTHLVKRIKDGVPTLILTRAISESTAQIVCAAPKTVVISMPATGDGAVITHNGVTRHRRGAPIWDLGVLTEELL